MNGFYEYTYNNGLISGSAYIYKEGSNWSADVVNANMPGMMNCGRFKTKKAAKERVERMAGAALKPMKHSK